jgi:hypothetical protein
LATQQEYYRNWADYKARIRALGLTLVDLVPVMNEATPTIASRLNGYAPFTPPMRARLDAFLRSRELAGSAAND